MRTASLCFAILVLAVPAVAADLTITEIIIDPSPALPGEPVWVTLSIRNDGTKPLPVPLAGILEAIPEGGEPVVLRSWDAVVSPLAAYQDFQPVVAPGETLRLDFTSGKIADGFLFQEPRLWKPGQHVLRVLLFDRFGWPGAVASLGHVPWPELFADGAITAPPIISPDAVLNIRTPAGIDAEAWATFMRRSGGVGFARGTDEERAELAYQIATKFMNSAYAPHFAVQAAWKFRLASLREERERFYRQVAQHHPDSAFAQRMRETAPWTKVEAAKTAADLATAYRLLDEARAEYQQMVNTLPRTLTRLQTQKGLKDFPTREDIQRAFEARRQQAAAQKR
jgi:hypothetical protein